MFIFMLSAGVLRSQDPIYSQFYANPLYLNPALAGTGDCARFIANARQQWPSLPGSWLQFSGSFDHFVKPIKGGVGLLIHNDQMGVAAINTLRISGIYSYHLDISRTTSLRAGFEVGMHQQRLKWEEMVFPDMIDSNTGSVNPSSEALPDHTSVTVPDFSIGFLGGYRKILFAGIAAHHLAQPDLSWYENSDASPLYMKLTAHAGAEILLAERSYGHDSYTFTLSPNVLYQYQRNARQLNVGFYLTRQPLTGGVFYRYSRSNPDAVVFMLGWSQKKIQVGYSYDVTLSRLQSTTGGAHEISLKLLVFCDKKWGKPGAIKCPEF
ncbi:MAG: PorP/SprF family type IX secretion system membrane protein [Bacteroidales bacterium]|nr:PorP/SprF family type IX secretion system membrane protein [Bacteroidales bacterium]